MRGQYTNKVREFRELQMTQEELARRLKKRGFRVTGSYICQIEAGLKHIPYGLALAITEELGFEAECVTVVFLPEPFTSSKENRNTISKKSKIVA